MRLLRALSSCILEISDDRDRTTSLSKHIVGISSWGKRFCLNLVWIILFSTYACCLSSSCHAPLCRPWLCLIDDLLAGTGEPAWIRCAQSSSLPRLSKPPFLSHSLRGRALDHWQFGGPPFTSPQFTDVFPVSQGPELERIFQMWSNKPKVKGNAHFPWPPDYDSVNRAQDAFDPSFP